MRTPLILLAAAVCATPSAAQTTGSGDDRWQLTLADGSYLWDVRLVKLEGDSIHTRRDDSVAVVSVAQVYEFRLIRKSELIVDRLGRPPGAMSALTGADDKVYRLAPLEFADRLRAVQKIFLFHPPEGQ